MMWIFRRSTIEDVDAMAQIAEEGKELLRSKGVSQWQRGTYPDLAVFAADVEKEIGYVVEEAGEVVAVCAVTFTPEPSYEDLMDGHWRTPDTCCYATIHRSAVARKHQGKNISGFLFAQVAEMARARDAVSIRVDTHPDNRTMQRTLERAGFYRCCRLILKDGDEVGDLRYGYERTLP